MSWNTSEGRKFKTEGTPASLTSSFIGTRRRSTVVSVNSSAASCLTVNTPLLPDRSWYRYCEVLSNTSYMRTGSLCATDYALALLPLQATDPYTPAEMLPISWGCTSIPIQDLWCFTVAERPMTRKTLLDCLSKAYSRPTLGMPCPIQLSPLINWQVKVYCLSSGSGSSPMMGWRHGHAASVGGRSEPLPSEAVSSQCHRGRVPLEIWGKAHCEAL